jgi:hypothetical protein
MAENKRPKSKTSAAAAERQKERSQQIEERIQEAQKRRQERQFLEELAKRVSIAREGRQAMEKRELVTAMQAYRRFLLISAKANNCTVEELGPEKYEEKGRVGEALLASQVFFDLLRMLDRLDSNEAALERRIYHKLFVRFTKGMPFQYFAAENLRRHLLHKTAIRHKKEFWGTYKALEAKGFCLVASWAFDSRSAYEVKRLRRFRDEVLRRSRTGRALVSLYYRHGEKLAGFLARIPGAKTVSRKALQLFVILLNFSERKLVTG